MRTFWRVAEVVLIVLVLTLFFMAAAIRRSLVERWLRAGSAGCQISQTCSCRKHVHLQDGRIYA
ncbi:MAG: hypothetical protein P4L33_15705 [Capsulimonadaceae bacterium]|nr:hypothetical protein [Capsulimonadaceae bacterium]